MPDAGAGALRSAAAGLGITVRDDAAERILRHLALLDTWNRRFHLTGEREHATLLSKHAVDSLTPSLMLPTTGSVIDIGSGAGFPGIILSCLRPDLDVVLIEPRRRPCSFLAESIRSIPLPRARVVEARAEETIADLGQSAAVVVCRALRLDVFLALAAPLLRPDGSVIAMQTPRADGHEGVRLGLRVAEIHDYSLPDGAESRRLLRFLRA
jgi:16S rRNA (guanine527-N7)-methyltransferase